MRAVVLGLFLTVAVLNVALGFASAAMVAHGRLPRVGRKPRGDAASAASGETLCMADESPLPSRPLEMPELLRHELPQSWLETLDNGPLCVQSHVEATIQYLRQTIREYIGSLVRLDIELRLIALDQDWPKLTLWQSGARAMCREWNAQQHEALAHLQRFVAVDLALAHEHRMVEQGLLEQTSLAEPIHAALGRDLSHGGAEDAAELRRQTALLVKLAHGLADRLDAALAGVLCVRDGLAGLPDELLADPLTGLCNRIGLAARLAHWWREDAARERKAAIVLLDADNFGLLNEQHGAKSGDQAVKALASLLDELLRKNRGEDVAVRLGGNRFLMFLSDTAPQDGVSVAERMRLTLDQTTFRFEAGDQPITLSAAVTPLACDDSFDTLITRANRAVEAAKGAGRNRTYFDDGSGATAMPESAIDVRGRLIDIL